MISRSVIGSRNMSRLCGSADTFTCYYSRRVVVFLRALIFEKDTYYQKNQRYASIFWSRTTTRGRTSPPRRRRWMSTDSARMSRPFLTITLLFSLLRLSLSLSSSHLLHQSHRREALFSLRPADAAAEEAWRSSHSGVCGSVDAAGLFSDEFMRESANVASNVGKLGWEGREARLEGGDDRGSRGGPRREDHGGYPGADRAGRHRRSGACCQVGGEGRSGPGDALRHGGRQRPRATRTRPRRRPPRRPWPRYSRILTRGSGAGRPHGQGGASGGKEQVAAAVDAAKATKGAWPRRCGRGGVPRRREAAGDAPPGGGSGGGGLSSSSSGGGGGGGGGRGCSSSLTDPSVEGAWAFRQHARWWCWWWRWRR